ncbi:uncharacterized protein LOC126825296 [Patella vulgata]|uniref:uncharacterized protein LOC126825296 n=1 Tax=Patella vulgata TaxID=6465 RepID=UPI0024A95E6B|nr:uncharacterized protein LOC126825296 [Patella vulgata]
MKDARTITEVKEINMNATGTTSVTERIFNTLDVSFMMSGTYMATMKNTRSKLHLMYCVLVTCVALFHACRTVSFFLQPATLQDYLASHIAVGCLQLSVVFLNLVYWFDFHTNYRFLKEEFLRYGINYGLPESIQKRPRIIKYITTSLVAWILTVSVGFIVLSFYNVPELKIYYFPFDGLSGWKLVAGIFFITLSSIPSLIRVSTIALLFMFCTYVVIKEYERNFELTKSNVEQMTVIKLNMIIKQHEAVCDLLTAVNQIMKHFLAGSIVFSFPVHCFLWVTLTNYSSLSATYFAIISLWAMLIFLSTFGEYFIAAHVNTTAHKTLGEVWKIDRSTLPETGLKMINIFTTKLSGSTIGYDIYGFFTLQKSSILALFGTILTYFIVAVQFKPDGTGEKCLEILKNITSN